MRVTSMKIAAVPVRSPNMIGKVMKQVTWLRNASEFQFSIKLLSAWVQDSGDDWSPSSSSESDGDATDVIYEVEYEIASDSTADLDDEESDGSSDIEVSDSDLLLLFNKWEINLLFFYRQLLFQL